MDAVAGETLPPGWSATTLGELVTGPRARVAADATSNLPFVGLEHIAPNALRPHAFGRFGDMRSAASPFSEGDVLYARMRPYLNKVWRADREGVASAEFLVFPRSDCVHPDFLALLLHHRPFVEFARHASSGDRPRVEWADIAGYSIWLPPLAEQARIVAAVNAVFEEVEAGEAALARARESLTQFRASLLHAACTGALTADWRAANATNETGSDLLRRAFASAPVAEAAPLWSSPATWAWTKVGLAGQVDLGRQRAPQHHDGPHMRPYLRVANVLEDRLDLSDVKHMNFDPDEFEHYALRPGDILLNEGQAPDLIGRPAIYRGEIAGCCFQKTLLRFRAAPCCTSDFAQIVFMHYLHSGEFRKLAPITTNIAHLTRVRFVEMPFPVPPLEEQDAIVSATRSALESMGDGYLGSLAEPLQSLRQSILHAAFTGRLVPQNPDDEPAAALLARLRASPAAPHAPRKRRATAQPDLIETAP